MKVNPILTEIYRGEWLLDYNSIMGFAPILQKLVSGEEVIFGKTGSALIRFEDKNGRRLQADDEGGIDIPKGSIAHVYMQGPILKHGDICTYGAEDIAAALRMANEADNVKGIVFHIDGPGGSVSSMGPFMQFAKEKKKPVIGLADTAYSAHYWTACAVCDYIIADNDVSAGFGSVGVMLSFVDTKPMMEKAGYVFHEIYPKESEHKNEAFKLAREGKYDMIKEEHLSPTARKFQAAVRMARPNLKEVTGVLTGKTFNADLSLEYGMIDAIGSIQDALERIAIMNELRNFSNN